MKLADLHAYKSINEDQKFDFQTNIDSLKKDITIFLTDDSKDEDVKDAVKRIKDYIYAIIVNDVSLAKVGSAKNIGLDDNAVNAWKNYFSGKFFNTGGGGPWSQVDLNSNISRKSGNDRTYNYYITVERDKENVSKFLKSYNDLISKMRELSNAKQTPISFKTHRHLDYFVTHNDSLKIYYYDKDVESDVVATVKKWLSDNRIRTGTRTHEFGVDKTVQGDSSKSSYGQILSDHATTVFTNTMKKYGKKFSVDQYVKWLEQHLPTIIKQVKPQN